MSSTFRFLMIGFCAQFVLSIFTLSVFSEDRISQEKARLQKEFTSTDADGDGKITSAEYLKREGSKNVLSRDFLLFDFDKNEFLDKAEFSCTPNVIHPSLRGPIPDPIEGLRLVAIDALDQSFEAWSDTPEREIDARNFVSQFTLSISPNNRSSYSETLRAIADRDNNTKVDWEEANWFIEVQIGTRTPEGVLLREPSGRTFSHYRFQWVDANKDGNLTQEEFLSKYSYDSAATRFEEGDLDQDNLISLEESANPLWAFYDDPVMEFRSMDTDFDGLVSREEMVAKTPEYRAALIPIQYDHFDDDGDGKASLEEFRISPLGNRVCPWWTLITDTNRDRKLLFQDFKYRYFENHLLWRFYFARCDTNGDNSLTLDEFPFKTLPPQTLHRISLATKELKLIIKDEQRHHCGSPAVSPDGQMVLFDGWGTKGISGSHIYVMTIDGDNVRDLISGLMPSWAPDGQKFACSRYDGGSGVWIVSLDGSVEKKIDNGWGAQWSPDGKTICYTKGRDLNFYDVEKDEITTRLTANDHDYRYLYYNMAWSPDGSRIAIKAYKDSKAITDIFSFKTTGDDKDIRVHLSTDRNPEADLNWFPDGKNLLLTLNDPEKKHHLPYKLGIEEGSEPKLLEGIQETMNYNGITISPDGKWIVVSSQQ